MVAQSIHGLVQSPSFERGKPIRQRYDELCSNISVYETKLQSALMSSLSYKEGLENAIKVLQDLKKQLDKLSPVSTNLTELRSQAQQFKVHLGTIEGKSRYSGIHTGHGKPGKSYNFDQRLGKSWNFDLFHRKSWSPSQSFFGVSRLGVGPHHTNYSIDLKIF